jgi:predicted porin
MNFPQRLAALTTIALAASAHAQVQIYGTLDLAVGQIETQPPGPPNAPIVRVRGVHNGGLQTSYLGFRATEDLGDGLKAKVQLEGFLRGDTGQTGRFDASPGSGADPMWSRDSYVGLAGSFGEVRLGDNAHPTWISMFQTSAMGTNSVFSPSFRQLFNGGTRGVVEVDTALVNSIKYLTPFFGGLDGSVALQAGEGSGRFSYSANVVYRGGPVLLSAATTRVRHAATPALPGARDQTTWLIGGAYDFGVVRLFAQYTDIDNKRLAKKDKLPHAGFTVPIGLGVLQFSRGEDKTSGSVTAKRTTTSLGYVYSLSKRTDLYAFGMADKVSVGSADSYVVGMRHRF